METWRGITKSVVMVKGTKNYATVLEWSIQQSSSLRFLPLLIEDR